VVLEDILVAFILRFNICYFSFLCEPFFFVLILGGPFILEFPLFRVLVGGVSILLVELIKPPEPN